MVKVFSDEGSGVEVEVVGLGSAQGVSHVAVIDQQFICEPCSFIGIKITEFLGIIR